MPAGDTSTNVTFFRRLLQFLRKPAVQQRYSMRFRWLTYFPRVPVPLYLPQIGWWLARDDSCGRAMLDDSFEKSERRFVERVLRSGMTVVDIGAHHGLYTLLASRKVGPRGRVVAVEPSVRERNYLLRHLRLNRCRNVQVEAVALGSHCGTGELFVVEGMATGCNCLRPPNVPEPTRKIPVEISTLDEQLKRCGIGQVDFIKIDTEGGELDVFMGAMRLLKHEPRPVMLVEVHDTRTIVWGYRSREIVNFLRRLRFHCFSLSSDSVLQPLSNDLGDFNQNVVAIPDEQKMALALPEWPSS